MRKLSGVSREILGKKMNIIASMTTSRIDRMITRKSIARAGKMATSRRYFEEIGVKTSTVIELGLRST